MKTYHGSCHCGAVQFEAEIEMSSVTECNCSICSKKGVLLHRVTAQRFRLISGEDVLQLYKFNTERALHYFCRICGIHPFHRPRLSPGLYNVNVRCLDDFDLESERPEVRKFDGKHWERTVERLASDKGAPAE